MKGFFILREGFENPTSLYVIEVKNLITKSLMMS